MRIKIKICMLSLGITLLLIESSAATDYYVRPPETCTNTTAQAPYTNWAMAATNIQWVIDLAQDDDTITVSNGTYDLNTTITMQYGFVMQSADYSAREKYPILNGGGANITGVIVSHDNAVLCGFTLKDFGTSSGQYGTKLYAGTVTDCIFTGCYGGAYLQGLDLVLSNCVAVNSKEYGFRINASSNVLLVNSHSYNNQDSGIRLNYATNANIRCCVFSNNPCAGIYVSAGMTVAITDCDIVNNTNNNHGGGIRIASGSTTTTVERCRIIGNIIPATYRGGGIACYESGALLSIRNTLIAGNESSHRGGGVYMLKANTLYMENCTVVSNIAGANFYAGGVDFHDTTPSGYISNSIIYYNRNPQGFKDLYAESAAIPNIKLSHICTPAGAWEGIIDNHIVAEPEFVDLEAGNFELCSGSPCINTGANHDGMEEALDLAGRPRIDRVFRQVDIGCYEFLPRITIYNIR